MQRKPRHFVCHQCKRRILPGDRYWVVDDTVAFIKLDGRVERKVQPHAYCDRCGKEA